MEPLHANVSNASLNVGSSLNCRRYAKRCRRSAFDPEFLAGMSAIPHVIFTPAPDIVNSRHLPREARLPNYKLERTTRWAGEPVWQDDRSTEGSQRRLLP